LKYLKLVTEVENLKCCF